MDKEPIIYLLCGKARHGKTTSAGYIEEYYKEKDIKCVHTLIAQYLKFYVQKFFGWDGKDETKPRDLLQQLGTEVIRQKLGKELFFVNRTIEDIDILKNFFDVFVIDDIRLPIEIETLRKNYKNVKVINIIRPEFESDLNATQKKHATEIGLDNYNDYDYVVINDGSLEDLKNRILDVIK